MVERGIEIPSTLLALQKSLKKEEKWEVGGVASGYWRDLDEEAVDPNAVREAIPGFMAARGPDGTAGGPIHLHHGFWDEFLRQAIRLLGLGSQQQEELIAGISLPLGRVTEMWVDDEGTTHWRGMLSQANPVSRVIWQLLKEKLVPLGVSLGGKILSVVPGHDRLGRPCQVINRIRLDELSITANPALRLTEKEDPSNGAYIAALAKAVRRGLVTTFRSSPVMNTTKRFLAKALSPAAARYKFPPSDWGSASDFAVNEPELRTGLDRPPVPQDEVRSSRRQNRATASDSGFDSGVGRDAPRVERPRGQYDLPTDVWGLTVPQLTAALRKCACGAEMDKEAWSSPEVLGLLQGGAAALSSLTDNPPMQLVGLVQLLQQLSQFAQHLPQMGPWQAEGTLTEMKKALSQGLDNFDAALPKELKSRPFRPPGSPAVGRIEIPYPQQYLVY